MPPLRAWPIMHFTHVANLPGIASVGGLLPDCGVRARSIDIHECGDVNIKDSRRKTPVRVAPGGVVGEYVPFYFAPRSPMLYKISRGGVPTYPDGQEPLVYIVSSLATVDRDGLQWIGSDGNIAASMSEHTNEWSRLETIVDWPLMLEQYWSNTDEDGDRMRRRMAELLVHHFFPDKCIEYLVVKSESMRELARSAFQPELPVHVRPNWYYKARE